MLQFLRARQIASANNFAEARGWITIGFGRCRNAAGDDIRAVRRMSELSPTVGITPLIKCDDFSESNDAEAFERMVKSGSAKWLKV
jgi:hypothetical protein